MPQCGFVLTQAVKNIQLSYSEFKICKFVFLVILSLLPRAHAQEVKHCLSVVGTKTARSEDTNIMHSGR